MTADLTLRTLRLTHGKNAPRWITPETLNLDAVIATSEAPMVGLLQSDDKQRIAGRFFPIVQTAGQGERIARSGERSTGTTSLILVFEHEDPQVTRATIVHELCHWLTYCHTCGGVPRTKTDAARCRYKGEHDGSFYDRLESLYRACNVPLYAARMVEGEYPYPEHWNYEGVNEAEWPAVAS
jgi:hypothetical protein